MENICVKVFLQNLQTTYRSGCPFSWYMPQKHPRQNANNSRDELVRLHTWRKSMTADKEFTSLCQWKGIWIKGMPSPLLLSLYAPFPCGLRFPSWAFKLLGLLVIWIFQKKSFFFTLSQWKLSRANLRISSLLCIQYI